MNISSKIDLRGKKMEFLVLDEFWRRVNSASFFVPRTWFRKARRRSVTLESQRGHFSVETQLQRQRGWARSYTTALLAKRDPALYA